MRWNSINDYLYIKENFSKINVAENINFQKIYKSFYKLTIAGLTEEFIIEYFSIMEKSKNEAIDIDYILRILYEFKTKKGVNSIQFSFATKLLNTINDEFPIYDSKVRCLFDFPKNYRFKSIDKKIQNYKEQHLYIKKVYNEILNDKLLESTFEKFDKKFGNINFPLTKKIDFIFWEAGKLISKQI